MAAMPLPDLVAPCAAAGADRPPSLPRPVEAALVAATILVVSFAFLASPGTFDVSESFLPWMALTEQTGIVASFVQVQDYPPLAFAALRLAGLLAEATGMAPLLALKLLLAGAGLLASAVLLRWLAWPFGALLLFLLWGPSAMAHGYLDVLFLPFLLGMLWAFARGALALGIVLFVVAFLIKWQPVIIAPFVLAYVWRGHLWRGPDAVWRTLLPAAIVAALMLGLFGMALLGAFLFSAGDPYVSGHAFNLQWLVTAVLEYYQVMGRRLDPEGLVRLFNRANELPALMVAAKAAFLLAYGWALAGFIQSRRGFTTFLYSSLVGYMAYFTINTGVHENHLFTAAALAVVLAGYLPAATTLAATLVLVHAANLLAFYGLTGDALGFSRMVGIDGSLPMAALVTALFAVLLAGAPAPRLIGALRRLPARREATADAR